MPGKLYLLPCPLGADSMHTIPDYVQQRIHSLEYFICEKGKTARAFIKATGMPRPLQELTYFELNKRTERSEWQQFLQPALVGNDIGLLSEAGCPGVADPGAVIVELAHKKDIEVVPLVGPSSILLAVMGSGMNGQNFAFNGYLAAKKPELAKDLRRLEQNARKHKQLQLFIETPYRNGGMLETAMQSLSPDTRFGIAVDLTLPTEWIKVKRVGDWRKSKIPDLHKRPAIFMIG